MSKRPYSCFLNLFILLDSFLPPCELMWGAWGQGAFGKKCFTRSCTTGYKSGAEKLSLFSAPKEEESLRVWRNTIPHKNLMMQYTDHLCERHFKPHLVTKTSEAFYSGNVVVRTPQKLFRSKERCSAYYIFRMPQLRVEREGKKYIQTNKRGQQRCTTPFKKQHKKSPECSDAVFSTDSVTALCGQWRPFL